MTNPTACTECEGQGRVPDIGLEPGDGDRTVRCPKCHGECATCQGWGDVAGPDKSLVECPHCEGTGLLESCR
jgi:DnaJ-class molecular chaperone